MKRPLKFSKKIGNGALELNPFYTELWFHGGRLYVATTEKVANLLAQLVGEVTVHLSEKWTWEIDTETMEIREDGEGPKGEAMSTISWEYSRRENESL